MKKRQDKTAILNVLGTLCNKPMLLEDERYALSTEDFPERFHRIVFATIEHLHSRGANRIDFIDIDNYLSKYPDQHRTFNENRGPDYIKLAKDKAERRNYDYYYKSIRKYTILRELEREEFSIANFNQDTTDDVLKQKIQEEFDSTTMEGLLDYYDERINKIRSKYLSSQSAHGAHAGKGAKSLIEKFKKAPDFGVGLMGGILNTVTRGARLKKLYMRSAPTGVGKTRLGAGDAAYISATEWYDESYGWQKNKSPQPTLFITTELELDEVQTMFLSAISGVNEDHILDGEYELGEEERVIKAAEIMEKSPLWIEHLPNYDIPQVTSTIKRYTYEKKVKYVFFDYIHTTMKMLEEITSKVKGMALREDNMLLIFVTKLKDLANELGIFIYTSTQVNGDWENKKDGNQNLLRGAKAMADKLDIGSIVLPPTEEDLECLAEIIKEVGKVPNMVYHVYKARRSPYKATKVWCYANMGACRLETLFMTDNNYKVVTVKSLDIEIDPEFTDDEIEKLIHG